jgi:hypothetical protein
MTATANQIIAMLFPAFTAIVCGIVVLIVRKPWARRRKEHNLVAADLVGGHPELDAALLEADRLIQDVRRQLRLVK